MTSTFRGTGCGTQITNQYPLAAFSTTDGAEPVIAPDLYPGLFQGVNGISTGFDAATGLARPLYVDFTHPVNDVFIEGSADSIEHVKVFFNGECLDVDNPTWGLYSFDLSAYPHLTRIEIYPDPNLSPSPVWNVLSFSVPPSLLALSVADDADPASTATASDAAIQESYVEEDQASEAAHVNVTAIRGASQDPENIHVTITRDDGTVVRDAVLGVSGVNAGTLADVSLPVTDTARDFAIVAWDAWDQTGQAGRKEIDVHVASLDVGTMGVVNGHNGSTSWLANDEKNSDGAWLPLNTENNAYQFTGTTPNQDRNENGDGKSTEQGIVSFTDDALLPIQITPSDDATSYSLTFNQNILHIFQYVNHTGMVHSGDVLTVNAPRRYYVEGFAGRAGTFRKHHAKRDRQWSGAVCSTR